MENETFNNFDIKKNYDTNFKAYESIKYLDIKNDIGLIIRLDGKDLTSLLKKRNKNDICNLNFVKTMKNVLEKIVTIVEYIKFAYAATDELSFELDYEKIPVDMRRLEKLISLISGYVSSMFSIEMQKITNEIKYYSFDARLLILPKNKIKDYFYLRQCFCFSHFLDVINSRNGKKITNEKLTLNEVKIKYNVNYKNIEPYFIFGYVGYYKKRKWKIKKADFLNKK